MSRPHERLFDALSTHAHSVVLKEGERQLTGAQVLQEISERASRLRRHRCERIALALDNGLEWVLWDLAILRVGRVCVPLPGFFSPNQQCHVLDSAGVDSLIVDDVAPWVAAGFGSVDERLAMREPGAVAALPPGTLKLTYTSGTTGEPKGVCLGVDAMLDVAQSLRTACSARRVSRHLCVLPLSVLLENIAGVYAPLLSGVRVELQSMADSGLQGSSRLDVRRFLSTLIGTDTSKTMSIFPPPPPSDFPSPSSSKSAGCTSFCDPPSISSVASSSASTARPVASGSPSPPAPAPSCSSTASCSSPMLFSLA